MARPLTASPGGWVTVPIELGAVRATMQVGDAAAQPAFIENVRDRRGHVETRAKLRCPNLRPGRYRVRVLAGGTAVEAQLTVT